tara:strand:- start:6518 stop:6625 length:108 start_codon:yes stop_codon:yes gene_type:complete
MSKDKELENPMNEVGQLLDGLTEKVDRIYDRLINR